MTGTRKHSLRRTAARVGYETVLADVARVIEEGRRAAARSVNTVMTTACWLIGRRIVDTEQAGRARARYGEVLLERLSIDLTARFGRGYSADNLETMRLFYLAYPRAEISETLSRETGLPFLGVRSDVWPRNGTKRRPVAPRNRPTAFRQLLAPPNDVIMRLVRHGDGYVDDQEADAHW